MGFYVQIKHKDMVNAKVQIWRLRPSLADTSPTNATGSGLSPGHRLRPPVQAHPMPPAQASPQATGSGHRPRPLQVDFTWPMLNFQEISSVFEN